MTDKDIAYPFVENAHLLNHDQKTIDEYERVSADVKAEPFVFVELAVAFRDNGLHNAMTRDRVDEVVERGHGVPDDSGDENARQVIFHVRHVEARVDKRGHGDERYESGESPRPAELHKILIDHVVLLRKVIGARASVAEQSQVSNERAHDQRAHVDANLDKRRREYESLEDEHETHVDEIEHGCLTTVDFLSLRCCRRRRRCRTRG